MLTPRKIRPIPLAYSVRASSLVFQELDRMHILEADFFGSDRRVLDKRAQHPDPEIRTRFFAAVNESLEKAKTKLATSPNDVNRTVQRRHGQRTDGRLQRPHRENISGPA